jgi:hypothetical protein
MARWAEDRAYHVLSDDPNRFTSASKPCRLGTLESTNTRLNASASSHMRLAYGRRLQLRKRENARIRSDYLVNVKVLESLLDISGRLRR